MPNDIAAGYNAAALRKGSLEFLALFEHHLSVSPKRLMQPGDLDPHFKTGAGKLHDCVAELLRNKPQYVRATGLQFAVADLSRDADHPDLAGSRIEEYWEAASAAKIGIAYAAFQMQRDLNAMAAQNSATLKTEADLFRFAQSQWIATQTWAKATTPITTPGGQPTLELADRLLLKTKTGGKHKRLPVSSFARPDPAKIFKATPNAAGVLEVSFKMPVLPGHPLWERPVKRGEFGAIGDLTYLEQLYTALDGSNNEGANAAIKGLGFIYIASVLIQSNLFDLSHANGLWLGRLFPRGDVIAPPVPDPLPRTPKDHQEIFSAQSARSGVTFMTLLAQNRLVDAAACDLIREMLDRSMFYAAAPRGIKTDSGTRSPVGDALEARAIGVDEIYSKIGIGGRGNTWDIAFVKRTTNTGKRLSYAISILDSVQEDGDPPDGPLRDIAFDLDQCVLKANT
jgi:hypothetical protein